MQGIKTRVTGRPTWVAAAGAQALDVKAGVLYVNLTDNEADWVEVDLSDLASALGLDDLHRKLKRLLAFIQSLGLGVAPGLEQDTVAGLSEFGDDLND